MDITIRQVNVFQAVTPYTNVSTAPDTLHIMQPLVSLRINKPQNLLFKKFFIPQVSCIRARIAMTGRIRMICLPLLSFRKPGNLIGFAAFKSIHKRRFFPPPLPG
jgi:hypothetical protein